MRSLRQLAGPEDWFILQVHYHNSAHHADALDKSGVALCTTDTPREHDAGIVTLGTVGIDVPPHAMGHEETGTCPSWITSYLTEPLHIIASFPHMHELGRKFRTDILRGGSEWMVEPLVEVEHFSFDDQKYYAHEPAVLLQPGDAVRTTCTYDNAGNVAARNCPTRPLRARTVRGGRPAPPSQPPVTRAAGRLRLAAGRLKPSI